MEKRITLEQYQSATGKNGIKWAGNEFPRSTKINTLWKCQNGHIFESSYNEVIIKNMGCLYCRGYKRIEDYLNFSRDGIRWVGIELPKNTKTKTLWQCSFGHIWESTWDNVVTAKSGCTKCPLKGKMTEQDYINAYQINGIKWTGNTVPKDTKAKTTWQCQNGHQIISSYENIVYKRSRCRHCPKSFAKTIEDYQNIKGKDGAHWIGKELPKNVTYHTTWQCQNGHIWRSSYSSIVLQGCGCPICQQSLGEFAIQQTLDSLDIDYVPQKTFIGCRYKNVLPFDFYFSLNDKEFLIEYDGLHHYRPVKFFGGIDGFKSRSRNDAIKTKFAQDNGFTLIRIPYTELDNIETIIKASLNFSS